jgi:hypothetical protein
MLRSRNHRNKRRPGSGRSMLISPSKLLAAGERDSAQPLNASQDVNNALFGVTYRTGPCGTSEKSGPSPSTIVRWTGEAGKDILIPFPAD